MKQLYKQQNILDKNFLTKKIDEFIFEDKANNDITTKHLTRSIISVFAKKKINISFKKDIKDKDGMAVKNYLKEKSKKKILVIKKHSLKESLLKISKYESSIKIKNK